MCHLSFPRAHSIELDLGRSCSCLTYADVAVACHERQQPRTTPHSCNPTSAFASVQDGRATYRTSVDLGHALPSGVRVMRCLETPDGAVTLQTGERVPQQDSPTSFSRSSFRRLEGQGLSGTGTAGVGRGLFLGRLLSVVKHG